MTTRIDMTWMTQVLALMFGLALLPSVARAQSSTTSACWVTDASGNLISTFGTTSCWVSLATNAFSQATISPSVGTIGAQVATPFPDGRSSGAQPGHDDLWNCATTSGQSCLVAVQTVPVALALKLEGSVTSAAASFIVSGSYSTSSGQVFTFDVEGGDGIGASARFFPDFNRSSTFTDVPVTLTTDATGVHFSIDFTAPTLWGCPSGSCSCSINCQFAFQNDHQFLQAIIYGDGTDQSVDVFHTFGVKVTSLDPSIILTSVDGRSGAPAGVNKPTPIQPPINVDGSSIFKLGQTIPVRLSVYNAAGKPVDGLAPQIALAMIAPAAGDVNEVLMSGNADTGTTLRGLGSGAYIFNLSTKRSQFNAGQDLVAGRYRLTISEPSFTAPVIVEFGLR
jgi:hypothetical protein